MFLGREEFVWWIGVVEYNLDPAAIGRVKVRIFGYHSPKGSGQIPTEDLPWAICLHSPNVGAYGRPNVGDWVLGFFIDGLDAQEPAIIGTIPNNISNTQHYPDRIFSEFSDPSFPAIYYNESIPEDTNRNSYYHELARKVRFVMDPEGSITKNPRIELKIIDSGIGIDLYSDSQYPTKNTPYYSHLRLSNKGKIEIVTNESNEDSTIELETTENGNIVLYTKGTEGNTAGGNVQIKSDYGSLLVNTPNGTVSLKSPQTILDSSEGTISLTAAEVLLNGNDLITKLQSIDTQIESNDSDITNINSNIESINSSIDTINNSDISTINSQISTLNSQISSINSALTVINNTLDDHESRIAALESP